MTDAPHRDATEAEAVASVRVGEVVAPEGPEDWRRPLTVLAAAGMLAAPLAALVWFVAWPPAPGGLHPGTWLLAGLLPLGAGLTGATQRGRARAFAGTLGAGLLAALLTVIVGSSLAPQRSATLAPVVAQAVVATLAGGVGVLVAAGQAPLVAGLRSRARRVLAPGLIGAAVSALVVPLLSPILG